MYSMPTFLLRPQPHRVDARSLAALRILLSLFILHDLYRRLEHGRLSLAWYTSTRGGDTDGGGGYFLPPILDPHDSPHGSPVHKVWFYRGSPLLQIFIFTTAIVVAALFGVGYRTHPTSVLLWLVLTGIQNRSPHLADGSDSYLRNVLLWCAVCPVGQVWSVDAAAVVGKAATRTDTSSVKKRDDVDNAGNTIGVAARDEQEVSTTTRGGSATLTRRHPGNAAASPSEQSTGSSTMATAASDACSPPQPLAASSPLPAPCDCDPVVQSVGTLGLTLQIALMYYGAVYRRFHGTMWLPPDLTAVYYVFNKGFASRRYAADFARAYPQITRAMTAGGMIVEVCAPAACLLGTCDDDGHGNGRNRSWRHVPAGVLALFHLSLYACMHLFNWQFLSAICCVVFVPTRVWDGICGTRLDAVPVQQQRTQKYYSAGGKPPKYDGPRARTARRCVSSFLLFYMIYNWCGERGWISKHDGGDVGQFLRFNQNWLMYGPDVSRGSVAALITGKIVDGTGVRPSSDGGGGGMERRLDLLRAIRTHDFGIDSEMNRSSYASMLRELPGDMAARYPSWRWEVAVKDWVETNVRPHSMMPERRVRRLGEVLCVAANDARARARRGGEGGRRITHVELAFWFLRAVEFGEATLEHRFDRAGGKELFVEVECA